GATRPTHSQREGVSADASVPLGKATSTDDVNRNSEQGLEVSPKFIVVDQGPPWLEIDKEVDVTVRAGCAASNGSEHTDIRCAVDCRYPENVMPMGAKQGD